MALPSVSLPPPAVLQAIIDAVADGNTYHHAAVAANISERTLYRLLARGRKEPESHFSQFLADIKKAEAASAVSAIKTIRKASEGGQVVRRVTITKANGDEIIEETFAQGQWQAAAWIASRRFPKDWAEAKDRMEKIEAKLAEMEAKSANAGGTRTASAASSAATETNGNGHH